ncbi:MAG: heme exporter protein CcmD [Proteobacteria bacterium]|nr:heme exporter protein CcmD [Pseudomonadota bacterium]
MAFENFAAFIDMGGYAAWVWTAYGLATVALVGMLVVSRRTLKARTREFEEMKANRK